MMTEKEFFELALAGVHGYAGSRGVRLGEGADGFIEGRLRQAATESANAPPDRQREMLREAEAATQKLIDAMILAAGEIPGYAIQRPGIIGEQTLGRALGKLCPLWPFC